ncbi:MAG TPA: DUF2891 domain-containing protein [Bacteroidales bacterium]
MENSYNYTTNHKSNLMEKFSIITFIFILSYIPGKAQQLYNEVNGKIALTQQGASHLASLPLKCLDKEFPFKPWYVISDSTFTTPKKMQPAFCGCYDWHSCVHGHWLLVALLKQFPQMAEAESIRHKLERHLSAKNINTELALFKGDNLTFERPYGWGWILQLQNELLTWNTPTGRELSQNLNPLARFLAHEWIGFLNKLQYPVREPEHYNLAFSMCLAWDYAVTANDTVLQNAIVKSAIRFYKKDLACPTSYEPGGYDFLSPCLEEADLMQRILPGKEFNLWLNKFMPELYKNPESLFKVCDVPDPTDAKMVHLYGLNFSRGWCLYDIAAKMPEEKRNPVQDLALRHFKYSIPHVVSGAYEGEHWLATFALLAIKGVGR